MKLAVVFALLLTAAAATGAAAEPVPAPAAEDFEKAWPAIVARLERATLDADVPGLKQAGEECQRWRTAAPPARQALVHYAASYSAWRLAFMYGVTPEERAAFLTQAADALEQSLDLEPGSAEAHALLAGILGAQIAGSPLSGMFRGPLAGFHLRKALAAEPNNPRVVLTDGLSAYHSPSMFGGSLERAETSLRRALDLFAQEPEDRPWPNWGRFDAHVWLGQLLARKGDLDSARREYDAALLIAPRSEWIRRVLMPALDKKAR